MANENLTNQLPKTSEKGRYFKELESLRGIAALVVVCFHVLGLNPDEKYLRLNPFYRGHESVILFFVLSGFVLSLRFYEQRRVSYFGFITRRIFRIYIPYWASIAIAAILCQRLAAVQLPQFSGWANRVWTGPPSLSLLAQHALLIGNFDNASLNPVIWSLTQEMRISLIFPFLIFLILGFSWPWLLGAMGVLTVVVALGAPLPFGLLDFTLTAHYATLFIVGALLAKNRVVLIERFTELTTGSRVALILAGLFTYNYSNVILEKFHVTGWVNDCPIALAAAVLMIAALAPGRLSKFLLLRPFVFLGKISYSLYLFHPIVVLTIVHLWGNLLPIREIQLLALLSSVACGTAMWYSLERFTVHWGHQAGKHVEMFDLSIQAFIKPKDPQRL
jgi:peptidoglycan/LPS O-acetylase OafA/YrhL